ncbi:GNAT family N-acetyltransferase, partial [Methylophaga sp. UBA3996]
DHFTVMERDGSVVACAALYPYPDNDMAELACLAVSNQYQSHGRGQQLLGVLEQSAKAQGINNLCVLTTQTAHWFLEHGFKPAEIADLPVAKQALYNYQRKSRVFRKELD